MQDISISGQVTTYEYGPGAVYDPNNPALDFGGTGTEQTKKTVTSGTTIQSETTFS